MEPRTLGRASADVLSAPLFIVTPLAAVVPSVLTGRVVK
jgi:hypothetical protein